MLGSRPFRWLALVFVLVFAAAGCGDDESDSTQPANVTMRLAQSGNQPRFTLPGSVPGGVVRISFVNAIRAQASAQIVRVDPPHRVRDGLAAAKAWGEQGKPLPSWVHPVGGTGQTKPGATETVTQELAPGSYFVVDTESGVSAAFQVADKEGDAKLPDVPARIDATEYSFSARDLRSGRQRILLRDAGGQPHFVLAAPIKPGKTIADVRKFARDEKGAEPIDQNGSVESAILDRGDEQVITANLRPSKYALICFVPDRQGGPPHALKGMISEATVSS